VAIKTSEENAALIFSVGLLPEGGDTTFVRNADIHVPVSYLENGRHSFLRNVCTHLTDVDPEEIGTHLPDCTLKFEAVDSFVTTYRLDGPVTQRTTIFDL
jgi:hypothetical protein